MSISITFQDPDYDEIIGLGEFWYVQLTHDLLHTCRNEYDGDNEEDIAYYNHQEDAWYFVQNYADKHGYRQGPWADIIFG